MTDDENTKLLEQFQQIIKELTIHGKESNCQHKITELLEELDIE